MKMAELMFKGKMTKALKIDVNQSSEPWTSHVLEDGTVLKTKSVLVSAVRIEGEYDGDGKPIYAVEQKQILSIEPPIELMRKDAEK